MAANRLAQVRIDGAIKEDGGGRTGRYGSYRVRRGAVAVDQGCLRARLPFDPLIPNATTIAAMKEARRGHLETVTLDTLQAVHGVDD